MTEMEKEEATDSRTLFIRNLPPKLKSRFKSWCALHDTTMTDQIIKMIEELIFAGALHEK